jgi:hypothetical protein
MFDIIDANLNFIIIADKYDAIKDQQTSYFLIFIRSTQNKCFRYNRLIFSDESHKISTFNTIKIN